MAIGKVNAFASVTAPQVDFGSVALNAQKFQQAADDEKLKMAISFKKAKDVKVESWDLKGESTGHGGLDDTNSSILAELKTQYYNFMMQGNLSEANKVQQKAFITVSQMKEARNSINSYDEAVKKGGISPASFSYTEAMNSFLRNNYDSKVVNGEAVIIPYQTRSDGKPVYGADGEKIPVKIVNAFGEEEPYLTLTSLNNWQAKIVPSVDTNKKAIEISKLLNLPTTKKEDGSVTIETTVLSDENKADIFDNVVKSLKTDRNFMINSAYKVSEDYKFPKKEYTEDDYKRVAEVVAGDIFPIYKQTNKKTEDELRAQYSAGNSKKAVPYVVTDYTTSERTVIDGKNKLETKVTTLGISGAKGDNPDKVATGIGFTQNGIPVITFGSKVSDSMSTSTQGVSGKGGASSYEGRTRIFGGENTESDFQQLYGVKYLSSDGKEKTFKSPVDVMNHLYDEAKRMGKSKEFLQAFARNVKTRIGLNFNGTTFVSSI